MIEVLHPGFLASIQDTGRYGYRKYGVAVSGAMDGFALRVANLLVGNPENAAGIEVTLGYGFKMRAATELWIAITGGDLTPQINKTPIPMWTPLEMRKDDILTFRVQKSGFRAYVAVGGGIESPLVMNSYSPMIGTSGGILKPGDRLNLHTPPLPPRIRLPVLPAGYVPKYESRIRLSVIFGPQEDFFTSESLKLFLHSEYTITPQSNRQGYRLEGPRLSHTKTYDVISEAVWPGAVQVPGDGLPIILCADAQTTGGYPKIASVISADVDKLGQAKPSDKISFHSVSIEEAHRRYLKREEKIEDLKRIIGGTLGSSMGI